MSSSLASLAGLQTSLAIQWRAYNLAHEMLAIKTFKTVAICGAYRTLQINGALLHDDVLLHRLYRKYVYGDMLKAMVKETMNPGSVLADKEKAKFRRAVFAQQAVVCFAMFLRV